MQNFNIVHKFYNDGGRTHILSKLRWNTYMMDVLYHIKQHKLKTQLIMCYYCEDYLPYDKVVPTDYEQKSFLCHECYRDGFPNGILKYT